MICNCSLVGSKACYSCPSNPNVRLTQNPVIYTVIYKEFPIKCIMDDWLIKCPSCKYIPDMSENTEWKYCPSCGQRVEWDND